MDLTSDDPFHDLSVIIKELSTYSVELVKKKRIIVGTKLDMPDTDEKLEELKAKVGVPEVVGISSITMYGIENLKDRMIKLLEQEGLLVE